MTADRPMVSIVVVCRADARGLEALLHSIEAQVYPEFEIVIALDAVSEDVRTNLDARRWIRPVRVLAADNTADRPRVFTACKGQYIAWAREAEIWAPDRLSLLVDRVRSVEAAGHDHRPALLASAVVANDEPVNGAASPRSTFVHNTVNIHLLDRLILADQSPGSVCLFHRELLDFAMPLPVDYFDPDWWLMVTAAIFGRIDVSDRWSIHGRPAEFNPPIRNAAARRNSRSRDLVPAGEQLERVARHVGLIEARFAKTMPAEAEAALDRFHRCAQSLGRAFRFAKRVQGASPRIRSVLLVWLGARRTAGELKPPFRFLEGAPSDPARSPEGALLPTNRPHRPWRERIGYRLAQVKALVVGRIRIATAKDHWITAPPSVAGKRVCLLASYSPDGQVPALTAELCRAWHGQGYVVILIIAADRVGRPPVESVDGASAILIRGNVGYDFGSWSAAIRALPDLEDCELLAIANDSLFGPLRGFEALLERVYASKADIVGLTDSYQLSHHIQSYLTFYKARALQTPALRRFWRRTRYHGRDGTILTAELPLKRISERAGLDVDVLFPSPVGFAGNPTLERWRELLESGFPFVKVQLLRDNPWHADIDGWPETLQAHGYDPSHVYQHLKGRIASSARVAAPRLIEGTR